MFLEALKGKNNLRPPVWLMRQAGRYMPSYQKLRKKFSLRDLFFTPELAAEITLMPVEQIGVDAAILFSDITVVALALGFSLDFSEGPVITKGGKPGIEMLAPIEDTIRILKKKLTVPLIGFCGGPYTVSRYMEPSLDLIDRLTEVTIEYVQMQEKAGVDAIQIFDTWASDLSPFEFENYKERSLKKIIQSISVPTIFFMRKGVERLESLIDLNTSALSFDWEKPLYSLRPKVPMAVQGNFDPDLLFSPFEEIEEKVKEFLISMGKDPGLIVNLGHGVKPNTPLEAVQFFVQTVQSFQLGEKSDGK